MLTLVKRLAQGTPTLYMSLPFEKRVKARFKTFLTNGAEVGVFLDRGPVMRGGDILGSDDHILVQVIAAPEKVSVVKTADRHLLTRAAYHLGNRHVPLEILPTELRYQHDHVLDQMLVGLGLDPVLAELPFEPESGAYGSHGVHGAHSSSHAH